jgi:hypothetical protein
MVLEEGDQRCHRKLRDSNIEWAEAPNRDGWEGARADSFDRQRASLAKLCSVIATMTRLRSSRNTERKARE